MLTIRLDANAIALLQLPCKSSLYTHIRMYRDAYGNCANGIQLRASKRAMEIASLASSLDELLPRMQWLIFRFVQGC